MLWTKSSDKSITDQRINTKSLQKIAKMRRLLTLAINSLKESQSSSLNSSKKHTSFESSEFQPIEPILANLIRGYLMEKHSNNTSQPHSKFVYLSPCHHYLCWKSLKKSDQKRLEIKGINKILRQDLGRYFTGMKVRNVSNCLVVVHNERNLQLEAISNMEADMFTHQILRVMKYLLGMRHNYKYHNE